MTDSFHSGEWYRIARAQPAMRRDIKVRRHIYLGRPWYVLSDATSGKVHRLTAAAYAVVGRLNGANSIDEIWRDVVAELGNDAPKQQDIVTLISQLHQSDLLSGADRPLLDDLLERRDKDRRKGLLKLLLNPLSATVPLFDPNRFLGAVTRVTTLLPRWLWWLALLMLLAAALLALPSQLPALMDRGLEGFLDLENLMMIAVIYPVIKAFHELGHGIAIKSRGGHVHEMGVIFIAFYPVPYVEASASLAFPSKWDRAAVAAAGVAIELAVAALALFVFMQAVPGTVRSAAYNAFLIAGFSTLLVNGNPLMKFDGYHVLSDIIEIPNLSQRGNAWWGQFLRRKLLGTRESIRASVTGWERVWFFAYPPLAFVYRVSISLTIALFVATSYRAVGIVLAIWSLALTLVWPTLKMASSALTDGRIARAGGRAVLGAAAAAAGVLALLLVPAPYRAVAQGVIWLPPEAIVRARSAGVIDSVHVRDGAPVQAGTALFDLNAPDLEAEYAAREARLGRLKAEYAAAFLSDRAKAREIEARLTVAETSLTDMRSRVEDLTILAAVDGRVDMPSIGDSRGRFLREGEVVGYILPGGERIVRVVVRQDEVDLVRSRLRGIDLRIADHPGRVYPGHIVREVPSAADALPSAALSIEGGGPFATVPNEGQSLRTVETLFQFDIAFAEKPETVVPYGMRVFVRFDFEPTALAFQIGRKLRVTFLSLFGA